MRVDSLGGSQLREGNRGIDSFLGTPSVMRHITRILVSAQPMSHVCGLRLSPGLRMRNSSENERLSGMRNETECRVDRGERLSLYALLRILAWKSEEARGCKSYSLRATLWPIGWFPSELQGVFFAQNGT